MELNRDETIIFSDFLFGILGQTQLQKLEYIHLLIMFKSTFLKDEISSILPIDGK